MSLTGSVELAQAMLLTLAVSLLVGRSALELGRLGLFMDVPNGRSLHRRPVPRAGGLALTLGMASGLLWLGDALLPTAAMLALCLMAVSLLDDLRGLSVGTRFASHVAAALGFVWLADFSAPTMLVLIVPLIVWATNLYNFMDGSDGLAGGMAVIGFGIYALAAWLGGDPELAGFCILLVAAAMGFLVFNFPPARLFLGDSGSIPLGFLAATLGLLGWQRGIWPPFFPVVVFSPFLADASVTLLKRALRGEKIWHAHREHYYQRMLRLGLGHRGTALVAYAMMLAAAGMAMAIFLKPDIGWLVVSLWCAALALAMRHVDGLWARRPAE